MKQLTDMEQKKLLGAVCRVHRIECGYTVKAFSDLYGKRPTTVSEFERGNSGNVLFIPMYVNLDEDKRSIILHNLLNVFLCNYTLDDVDSMKYEYKNAENDTNTIVDAVQRTISVEVNQLLDTCIDGHSVDVERLHAGITDIVTDSVREECAAYQVTRAISGSVKRAEQVTLTPDKVNDLIQKEVNRQLTEKLRRMTDSEV